MNRLLKNQVSARQFFIYKKSITLNLKDPKAKEIALKIIEKADIVLESNRPGVMTKLGLDYETVKKINPGIIYCSISGFGQTGPYSKRPGFDQDIQGYGGIMGLTGEKGGGPLKVGIAVTDIAAGMFAATGILTALYHRERTGQGQHFDASMLDSAGFRLNNLKPALFSKLFLLIFYFLAERFATDKRTVPIPLIDL
jgi:crotonobetainyl-CoA:carnitine CoA-transferase CaiB-like acyl-CoA transferase